MKRAIEIKSIIILPKIILFSLVEQKGERPRTRHSSIKKSDTSKSAWVSFFSLNVSNVYHAPATKGLRCASALKKLIEMLKVKHTNSRCTNIF